MKTILVLNYEYPPTGGGGATASHDIVEELKEKYNIIVLTMHCKGSKYIEKKAGVTIYRIKTKKKNKEKTSVLEQINFVLKGFKFYKKKLKNEKIDLIHAHFIVPSGLLAYRIKKKYNIPYIITAHGSDVKGHNSKFLFAHYIIKPVWEKIIKNAKVIVSPSKYLAKLIKKNWRNSPIKIIPNGINSKLYRPKTKKKYILCVARMVETKGVYKLAKIFNKISTKIPNWKLILVGTGPDLNKIKRISNDKIILKGWLESDSKELRKLYGESSIFVLNSNFENHSKVLLEALASGCSIIASRVGGNTEIIHKQSTYKLNDNHRLAQLILDRSKNIQKQKFNKEFHIKNTAEEYSKLYLKCAE